MEGVGGRRLNLLSKVSQTAGSRTARSHQCVVGVFTPALSCFDWGFFPPLMNQIKSDGEPTNKRTNASESFTAAEQNSSHPPPAAPPEGSGRRLQPTDVERWLLPDISEAGGAPGKNNQSIRVLDLMGEGRLKITTCKNTFF